ncbi:MAG: hypothetical protein ACI3YZ_05605 [Prevotella sp.]
MRYLALLVLWLMPLAVTYAQNGMEDGKRVAVDSFELRNAKYMELKESVYPKNDILKLEMPEAVMPARLQPMATPNPQAYTLQNPALKAPMATWRGGHLTAMGTTMGNPGLLDIATGGVMASQRFGNLNISVVAEANKYNFMWQGGVHTQYGVSGELSYKVSERVALTAFGSYYNQTVHTGPALMPYVNSNRYGGYATIMFSEHFGADVGVKRYLNPITGRWNTDPIVSPFLKVGKQKWGIDLGGLLRDVIWGKPNNLIPMTPPMRPVKK